MTQYGSFEVENSHQGQPGGTPLSILRRSKLAGTLHVICCVPLVTRREGRIELFRKDAMHLDALCFICFLA